MFESNDPFEGPKWWHALVGDGIPPRPQGRSGGGRVFDVIVVGGGASGHFASLFLSDLGCTVVMLEAGHEGGGTAYKSGAGMWFPDNSLMRERGVEPDRDWAIHQWRSSLIRRTTTPRSAAGAGRARVRADQHLLRQRSPVA